MSRFPRLVALSLAAFIGHPAAAAEYERSGDWVFHSNAVAVDGEVNWMTCVASTRSLDGTELVLRLEPAGDGAFDAAMALTNEGWNVGTDSARVRLDIGADRWMLQGTGAGHGVGVAWTADAALLTFLEDFASSSFAKLTGRDGSTISQFSLKGSRKAIEAMKSCVETQLGQGLDMALAAMPAASADSPF